jgi:pyridoxal 5'-phosphate synthase pdxT subunit
MIAVPKFRPLLPEVIERQLRSRPLRKPPGFQVCGRGQTVEPNFFAITYMAESRENAGVRDVQVALEFLAGESGATVEQAPIRPGGVADVSEEQFFAEGHRKSINGRQMMKIGVLALQGDFDAHRKRLEELGAEVVLVKKPDQLDEIDGLVIPGGESGTFLKLLGEAGFEKLKQFVRVKPTFGTCAGAILLANEVENPKQSGLGAIDIRIRRNAYGRQIDSSIREGRFGNKPIEMVFIRAPKIERVGPGVEVIATEGNDPVAVRQGRVMAATFHPELSEDTRVHQAFLDLIRQTNV